MVSLAWTVTPGSSSQASGNVPDSISSTLYLLWSRNPGFLKSFLFEVLLWLCSSKLGSLALPKILPAGDILLYFSFLSKLIIVCFRCWLLRTLVSIVCSRSVQRRFNRGESLVWENKVGVCHSNEHIKIRTRHLPGTAVSSQFWERFVELEVTPQHFQAHTAGVVLRYQTWVLTRWATYLSFAPGRWLFHVCSTKHLFGKSTNSFVLSFPACTWEIDMY